MSLLTQKRLIVLIMFIICFCFCVSSAAFAALDTVYLGCNGVDTNDGLTPSTPVASFAKAKSLLSPGGTINIITTEGKIQGALLIKENQTWSLADNPNAKVNIDMTSSSKPSGVGLNVSCTLTLADISIVDNEALNATNKYILQVNNSKGVIALNSGTKILAAGLPTAIRANEGTVQIGSNVSIKTGNSDVILSTNGSIQLTGDLTEEITLGLVTTLRNEGTVIGTVVNGVTDISKLRYVPVADEQWYFKLDGSNIVVTATKPVSAGTHRITATASSNGSISPSGAVDVAEGASQTFTITPDAGCSIIDVKVDGNSVLNDNAYSVKADGVGTYTFSNVTQVHSIAATFAHTITATAGGNGGISPASTAVAQGADQAFTITPDPGYCIDAVTVDGSTVASGDPNYSIDAATGVGTYTFRNVTADHSIAVTFKAALGLDVSEIDFGKVAAFSDEQPKKIITITNNSGAAAAVPAPVLAWESSAGYPMQVTDLFALDTTGMAATLVAGATTTFIIKPQTNLPANDTWWNTYTTITLGSATVKIKMTTVYTATIDPNAVVGEHGTATIDTNTYPCVNGTYYGKDQKTPAWFLQADPGYVVASCTFAKVDKDGNQTEVTESYDNQDRSSFNVLYAPGNELSNRTTVRIIFKSATFTADSKAYKITASVGVDGEYDEGTISPVDNTMDVDGVVSVIRNHDQTLTITPNPGYHLNKVYVDNLAVTVTPDPESGAASYSFIGVNANHSIIAEFAPNRYTIAFDKNADDATGIMGVMDMVYDSVQKLNPNAFQRPDYCFAGWATTSGGAKTYDDQAEVQKLTVQNNDTVTLYALWMSNTLLAPPSLSAATATVGQDIALTYEAGNTAWQAAISGITVGNGMALDSALYNTTTAGTITIDQSVFPIAKDYIIVVKADGYGDASVTQTIQAAGGRPVYTVTPVEDPVYVIGETPNGIKTITVLPEVSGLKYFGVRIIPVTEHEGQEAVVFVHMRGGLQLSLNITKADFDLVNEAQAGFNVQPGDVIRLFIVDDLTNDMDFNPTILQ